MVRRLLLLALLCCAQPVHAQTSVILRGQVIDAESSRGVRGAFVGLSESGQGVLTDSLGFFRLPVGRAASYSLRVTQLGYSRLDVTMPAEAEFRAFTVRLPVDPVQIQGLTVLTEALADRRRGPFGIADVMTQEQLLRAPDASAYELVRRVMPFVEPCSPTSDSLCLGGRLNQLAGGRRVVNVCVDGRRVPPEVGATILGSIDPKSLYMVESYTRVGEIRMYSPGYVQRMIAADLDLPPLTFGCSDGVMGGGPGGSQG